MSPKISVYTPSHDPKYLDECWKSLASQTFRDFEWIVVLNGEVRSYAPRDPKVHVVKRRNLRGVGALKREACKLAKGDILVELDHDDLLTQNALLEIVAAFDAHPEAGLVYSDFAQINEDGSKNTDRFADGHGWTYRNGLVDIGPTVYDVQVIESKPPWPHNVSYIWYAPNHVRAFSRAVYEAVGGYDATLEVCDDADLMCRMYQAAPFVHIPLCLYLQRMHGSNTQRDPDKNDLIQRETVRLYDEHVQKNALAWAKRENLECFDLGGAHACPRGYIAVDQCAMKEGDLWIMAEVLDWLEKVPDNSVGVIRAVDFMEHVEDKITLMNEIYRVLAPGGMLLSLTPSTDGRGAFCDPTHVSYWNELSFRYYCMDSEYTKYVPEVTARFRQSRLFTYGDEIPYVCFNGSKEC
jgi:glycosyltransferase involved in cell wall biosynthesis